MLDLYNLRYSLHTSFKVHFKRHLPRTAHDFGESLIVEMVTYTPILSILWPVLLYSRQFALQALAVTYSNKSHSLLSADPLPNPYPFYFPRQGDANSTMLFPMERCGDVVLEEASIDQLQDAMVHGKLNAVKLASCCLRRVLQVGEYIKYVSGDLNLL